MRDSSSHATAQSAHGPAQVAEIRAQVDKLLASPGFSNSQRKKQLLRYLVDAALAGRAAEVNEYAIGLDVFGRPASFDPRIDSTVRAEVSRFRARLKEYYAGTGRSDPVVIDFPSRGYAATFVFRDSQECALPEPASQPLPRRNRLLLIAGFAVVAVLAVTSLAILWLSRGAQNRPVHSLVVLPFMNLSADPQNDYLADGLTEDLTDDLAQWKEVRVVARTSAFLFKGKAVDIREVGRKLNVDTAIEGSFARQGDRIRITAQMNRTSDGYHIWSHSYETSSQDIMAVQDDIAQSIAAAVRAGGRDVAQVRTPDSTKDPEAHDLYLRANHELSLHTPDSYKRSLALFQEASQKDPTYVNAYIGIGRVEISLMHLNEVKPQQGVPAAKAALEKALQINPSSGEARGLLANLIEVYDWDWPRAEREFRRAIADGAQAPTHSLYGSLLGTRGRFREAQAQLRIAQDMDPLGMGPRFNQYVVFGLERKEGEAKRVLLEMLEMNPDLLDARFELGVTAAIEHNCTEARNQLEWCFRKFPAPVTKFGLIYSAACDGHREQAREYLEEALQSSKKGYSSPYQAAFAHAFLGDKEAALSFLEKSADTREVSILFIKYEPMFDGIRSDPRYIALERRVGLLP